MTLPANEESSKAQVTSVAARLPYANYDSYVIRMLSIESLDKTDTRSTSRHCQITPPNDQPIDTHRKTTAGRRKVETGYRIEGRSEARVKVTCMKTTQTGRTDRQHIQN